MRKLLFSLFFLVLLIPGTVLAADLRSSQSGSLSVGSGEKASNLYAAGQSVSVDANVSKDLAAAGSSVTINGSVENDLFAAGNSVSINGLVGDSARVAGSTVSINSIIGQDLLAAGATVNVVDKSVVKGDALIAGGTVDIAGKIDKDLKVTGGTVTISGVVSGDVIAREVNQLVVKKGAVINGKLDYSSPNQAQIESGAVIKGVVDFQKTQSKEMNLGVLKGLAVATFFYKMIGLFLFLLLIIYLAPKMSRVVAEASFPTFWANLGIGFLAMIVTPIIALILLFMGVTAGIGAVLGLLYIIYLVLSSVAAALILGAIILKLLGKYDSFRIDWLTAMVGAIAAAVLAIIPILGSLALFVFFLLGLGVLVRMTGGFIHANQLAKK